jgi:hypothetical protein
MRCYVAPPAPRSPIGAGTAGAQTGRLVEGEELEKVDRGLLEKWLRTVPGFGDATITVGCQRYGHPMRGLSKTRYLHFDWMQDGTKQWLELGPGTVREAFKKLGLRTPAVADLPAGDCG